MPEYTLHHGDCMDVMRTFERGTVDLIVADPPYFKVKGAWWDNQWNDADAYFVWLGAVFDEFARILAPNGSAYVFADTRRSARVETMMAERLCVINNIRWAKPKYATKAEMFDKDILRSYFPSSEAVLFCEHYGADNMAQGVAGYDRKCDELRGFVFEPLRAYLDDERKRAGMSKPDVDIAWQLSRQSKGVMSPHWFSPSQFNPPTSDNYAWLRETFNRNGDGEYLRREYEDLRREYEDLRREYEDLRRPFTWAEGQPYTDVWTYGTVSHYPGKHPCEKPQDMLCDMIRTSSREGGTVFDPFTGSGATGQAAIECGREFVGAEIDEHWFKHAGTRIHMSMQQESLF